MLTITKPNIYHEFEYEGIKLFIVNNTTKFYKDKFIDSSIIIDNKTLKKDEILYLSELSNISDFFNLTKKTSILVQKVLDKIYDYPIINYDNLRSLTKEINDELNYEVIESKEGDMNKLISSFLDLCDFDYVSDKNIKLLLDNFLLDYKLIIFDNCSWLDINILSSYLNQYNFIILTNDIRNVIKDSKYIETIVLEDNMIEILDYELLINYLESKLNEKVSNEEFNKFLNYDSSYKSYQIYECIKNIK